MDHETSNRQGGTTKVVIARKARNVGRHFEIRPGDQIRVTKAGHGCRRYRQRVAKGPGWATN